MKLALAFVGSLVAGPVIGLSALAGSGGGANATVEVALCKTSGPVAHLDGTQARNARTIVAATQQATVTEGIAPTSTVRAELVALMTAGVESGLHNWASPLVPASELVPNDGDPPTGGDHDSVGLFQQRTSWGSVATRMNPMTSTQLFVRRLLASPGWATMPPGVAAQAVQGSAYPDRYALEQPAAAGWLRQIDGSPNRRTCGSDGLESQVAGSPPGGSLSAAYAIPPRATGAERLAVTFALAQLGKPYVFGAAGPDSYDCSGLTMSAWATAGVTLPHNADEQSHLGTPVADESLLAPGDLIFIPGADGTMARPGHVGMYVGDGYVIEAPQASEVIKLVGLAEFGPVTAIRHYS